ncbi:MAG: glutaminase A [Pseudomonadales bacterium]
MAREDVRAGLPAMLAAVHDELTGVAEGRVASYIPELACADPNWFGIAVATTDGVVFECGDSAQPFTIQSVSKPFVYGLALEMHGRDRVLERIGVEPSGESFNSIILDERSNRPFNPMINSGAIVTADLIEGPDFAARSSRMIDMLSRYASHRLGVDDAVFASERTTGHRNRAIAHLMSSFGMLSDKLEETLELYFQQCSVLVTCRDLAVMGATLANWGVNPLSGQRAVEAPYVKDILSMMLSCGMYDYSGEWAYRVGLPAKSGVGGGIVAVVPGQGAIATFSPPLDEKGNSVRGIRAIEKLADHYGLHFLESVFRGNTLGSAMRVETD